MNLIYVKDNHGDGYKWPEMVVKLPFMSQFHFESDYRTVNELRKYLTEDAGARSYIHAPAFSTRYFLNLFCSSDYEYYLNLSLKHRAYKLYLLNMIATRRVPVV